MSEYYHTVVAPDEMKFIKENTFELYAGLVQVKWEKDVFAKP